MSGEAPWLDRVEAVDHTYPVGNDWNRCRCEKSKFSFRTKQILTLVPRYAAEDTKPLQVFPCQQTMALSGPGEYLSRPGGIINFEGGLQKM